MEDSKIKLMISYGGKITHRNHDNKLTYSGGDTKILTVDRHVITFSNLLSKLINLMELTHNDVKVKYKLPGHDLDALVSVFDDDDVANMLYEYDVMMRRGNGGRLRLFVFFAAVTTPVTAKSVNPDFLFGFDKEYSNNYTENVNVDVTRGSYVYPAPVVYGAPQQVVYKYVPVMSGSQLSYDGMKGNNSTVMMSATSDRDMKVGANGTYGSQLES
ncbi:hypothetical protein CTI12_AA083190 [Artemisia annua]|uniref:PB1 domain-containing protein n=1 Tax=Artemisia annua TaxID=35608 RepID=A0A2U1PS14_ARTAN|nr:hypothetical protein CTI12_AA083190 [Artemisia annua]